MLATALFSLSLSLSCRLKIKGGKKGIPRLRSSTTVKVVVIFGQFSLKWKFKKCARGRKECCWTLPLRSAMLKECGESSRRSCQKGVRVVLWHAVGSSCLTPRLVSDVLYYVSAHCGWLLFVFRFVVFRDFLLFRFCLFFSFFINLFICLFVFFLFFHFSLGFVES